MSHMGNDRYNDYLIDQVDEAKAIILKSLKSPSGKLLVEYPDWLKLSYEARVKAYEELTCPRCNKIRELTGYFEHYSDTDPCCKDCSDGNNQRLQDFRKDWDLAFTKYHGKEN